MTSPPFLSDAWVGANIALVVSVLFMWNVFLTLAIWAHGYSKEDIK